MANGFDVADDWIAEHVELHDIVIMADMPLASRCLEAGAHVVSPTGKPSTVDKIGSAVETRTPLTELRHADEVPGGLPPLQQKSGSRFLQKMDAAMQSIRRKHPVNSSSLKKLIDRS